MAKIDGPRPQLPSIPSRPLGGVDVVKTPSPAGPVPVPVPNLAVTDTGFAQAAKKLLSITGRHKAGAPGIHLGNEGLAGNLLSVKQVAEAKGATAAVKLNAPPAVADLVKQGVGMKRPKDNEVEQADFTKANTDFKTAQSALAKTPPDYAKAAAALDSIVKDEMAISAGMAGGIEKTTTVRNQVAFLAKMEAAGIKADYPPTDKQLLAYFGSKGIKDHPDAARKALGDYQSAFHEHVANVPGAKKDVEYTADDTVVKKNTDVTTHVPETWDEVLKRPVGKAAHEPGVKVQPKPESIAKQANDCEGFAFMAEQLMKEAGFEVKNHVTLNKTPPPQIDQHAMVEFTHPKEKGKVTVTSNQGVFTGKTESEALKKGWEYANGGKSTGKEKYFTGKTMHDSQVNATVVDAKHTVKVK